MRGDRKRQVSHLCGVSPAYTFCLLSFCLVVCGIVSPWYLVTKSLPKYHNYLEEEKHHVKATCFNITSTYQGKLEILSSGISYTLALVLSVFQSHLSGFW